MGYPILTGQKRYEKNGDRFHRLRFELVGCLEHDRVKQFRATSI